MIRSAERRLLLGALPGLALGNFAIFSSPIYIGSLMDGLGFSADRAGLTSSVEIGAVALTCVVLSASLGSLPLRKLALGGIAGIVICNLVSAVLSDPWLLIGLRAGAGAGAGMCLAVAGALISRGADPDRMVGLLLVVNILIMAVMLTVLGHAKTLWMFTGFLAVFTALAVVLLPLLLLLSDDSAAETPRPGSHAVRQRMLLLGGLGLVAFFMFCLLEGSVWSFSERGGAALGLSDGDIGELLATSQLSGLVGGALAAFLGARLPRIFPILLGTLMMGLAGLVIYQTGSPLFYGVFLSVFSLGFFVAFPYLIGAFARLDSEGRWVARANGVNLMGGAMAPFVAASVVTSASYGVLGYFCMMLAMASLVLTLVFCLKLPGPVLTPASH